MKVIFPPFRSLGSVVTLWCWEVTMQTLVRTVRCTTSVSVIHTTKIVSIPCHSSAQMEQSSIRKFLSVIGGKLEFLEGQVCYMPLNLLAKINFQTCQVIQCVTLHPFSICPQ